MPTSPDQSSSSVGGPRGHLRAAADFREYAHFIMAPEVLELFVTSLRLSRPTGEVSSPSSRDSEASSRVELALTIATTLTTGFSARPARRKAFRRSSPF